MKGSRETSVQRRGSRKDWAQKTQEVTKKECYRTVFFQTQQSFRSINFGTARSLHAAALERIKYAFSRLVFTEFKIRPQWRVTEMVKILLRSKREKIPLFLPKRQGFYQV
jgi:hypothetical protein